MAVTTVVALICITGCAQNAVTVPTSTSITPTFLTTVVAGPTRPLSTATFEPTKPSTPTFTPLPSPTLAPFLISDLVFQRNPQDCILPCWQSLRVGSSSADDVYTMLERVFSLNEPTYLPAGDYDPPQGYQVMGNTWDLSHPPLRYLNSFAILALINQSTNRLEGLNLAFQTYDPEFDPHISPRRAMTELGIPSFWLVQTEVGGQDSSLEVMSIMIYQSGVIFFQRYSLTLNPEGNDQPANKVAQFCLGNNVFSEALLGIGEPFVNGYKNLSPAQTWTYVYKLDDPRYRPIQDVFNVSLGEISKRISHETNPCLSIIVSNP